MQIPFNFTHVFTPGSNQRDNAYVLRALLDCLVNINLAYLRHYSAPDLYRSGVVYGRTILWEGLPEAYSRGFADCKSLTPILIAQLRLKGYDATPVFRFVTNRLGGCDFHILVMVTERRGIFSKSDTYFTDPSRKLGMGANECARFYSDSEFKLR